MAAGGSSLLSGSSDSGEEARLSPERGSADSLIRPGSEEERSEDTRSLRETESTAVLGSKMADGGEREHNEDGGPEDASVAGNIHRETLSFLRAIPTRADFEALIARDEAAYKKEIAEVRGQIQELDARVSTNQSSVKAALESLSARVETQRAQILQLQLQHDDIRSKKVHVLSFFVMSLDLDIESTDSLRCLTFGMAHNNTTAQTCFVDPKTANSILIALYTIVIAGGTTGNIIMIFLLSRTNTRSLTTTAIINLLVVHCIFLFTVPFRIIYYAKGEWHFGFGFCKFISSMIHIHMYLSFIFYVAMLSIRYVSYFKQKDKIEFYRTLHSVVASAAVWFFILLVMAPVFYIQYGTTNTEYGDNECFKFQKEFVNHSVVIVNYVTVVVVCTVVCILLVVQIVIIVQIVKKLKNLVLDHQEFWAQLKSLFFILVMIICFFPFHMFRIYYLNHKDDCYYYNEIFLGITALSCLDLLSFSLQTISRKCSST
ncbi:LOW QUALITY PROTEIN: putative G-protein coupled receptor 141 [Gastrophryne carolinensis]